ncbi:hypothetical protein RRG08_035727 [Elysia crispata]|uniref:Uncharacterized protein n=1 Tax=Elysia crispata TaxID=231223 RepID=A0AAE0YJI7_9GAST|nr:hypothetical protein RRG08_035727 [Elysia crispata]
MQSLASTRLLYRYSLFRESSTVQFCDLQLMGLRRWHHGFLICHTPRCKTAPEVLPGKCREPGCLKPLDCPGRTGLSKTVRLPGQNRLSKTVILPG